MYVRVYVSMLFQYLSMFQIKKVTSSLLQLNIDTAHMTKQAHENLCNGFEVFIRNHYKAPWIFSMEDLCKITTYSNMNRLKKS